MLRATKRHESGGDEKGSTVDLSQQVDQARGSLTLGAQGKVASGPGNDEAAWHYQTGRARQDETEKCTRETSDITPLN